MLKKIMIGNKLLSIFVHGDAIYIGDALGNLYRIKNIKGRVEKQMCIDVPISSIAYHGEICVSGWDGSIHFRGKKYKFGNDMIKSIISVGEKLFVSIGKSLLVLNRNMEIVERHMLDGKIYTMDYDGEMLRCGMSSGKIGIYRDRFEMKDSMHQSNIIAIKGNLSGCCDGKLVKDGKVIFEENGWIGSIFSKNLHSSGRKVYYDGQVICEHEDMVTGVVEFQGNIVSVGLDGYYNIYRKEDMLDKDEMEIILNEINS